MLERLRQRHAESTSPWIFPSSMGTLRDPDNTGRQLRSVIAVPNGRSASARVPATGCDRAREIADYLGPEKVSATQDDYMERRARGARAAKALGSVLDSHPQKHGYGVG